jgi:hypothetical protein
MVIMTKAVSSCHIRCVKDRTGIRRGKPGCHTYGCWYQSNPPGIAVSDHSGDNDVSWDVARGASSLMVSSLAVASNGKALGGALLGMSRAVLGMSAWSSRASRLALSLDLPEVANWCCALRYPNWYRGCCGSLASLVFGRFDGTWGPDMSGDCVHGDSDMSGECCCDLMLGGVCVCVVMYRSQSESHWAAGEVRDFGDLGDLWSTAIGEGVRVGVWLGSFMIAS